MLLSSVYNNSVEELSNTKFVDTGKMNFVECILKKSYRSLA
jgi:hypothetical protein